MNWGIRIIIVLGLFMSFIISVVVYMTNHDKDTLIDNDYYEKSLTYDEVYSRRMNLQTDHATPVVTVIKDTLYVSFVNTDNQGQLQFKRLSDSSKDITLPFNTLTKNFQLPIATFIKGSWDLDLAWESNHKAYISSHRITL